MSASGTDLDEARQGHSFEPDKQPLSQPAPREDTSAAAHGTVSPGSDSSTLSTNTGSGEGQVNVNERAVEDQVLVNEGSLGQHIDGLKRRKSENEKKYEKLKQNLIFLKIIEKSLTRRKIILTIEECLLSMFTVISVFFYHQVGSSWSKILTFVEILACAVFGASVFKGISVAHSKKAIREKIEELEDLKQKVKDRIEAEKKESDESPESPDVNVQEPLQLQGERPDTVIEMECTGNQAKQNAPDKGAGSSSGSLPEHSVYKRYPPESVKDKERKDSSESETASGEGTSRSSLQSTPKTKKKLQPSASYPLGKKKEHLP